MNADRFSAGQATTIGAMRHCVTVQRPEATQNSHGEPVVTWEQVALVRAKVEPVAGTLVFNAEQQQPQVTHRVTMRFREDVRLHAGIWRLLHNSRVFRIASVMDVEERRRFLVVDCVEQPPTAVVE